MTQQGFSNEQSGRATHWRFKFKTLFGFDGRVDNITWSADFRANYQNIFNTISDKVYVMVAVDKNLAKPESFLLLELPAGALVIDAILEARRLIKTRNKLVIRDLSPVRYYRFENGILKEKAGENKEARYRTSLVCRLETGDVLVPMSDVANSFVSNQQMVKVITERGEADFNVSEQTLKDLVRPLLERVKSTVSEIVKNNNSGSKGWLKAVVSLPVMPLANVPSFALDASSAVALVVVGIAAVGVITYILKGHRINPSNMLGIRQMKLVYTSWAQAPSKLVSSLVHKSVNKIKPLLTSAGTLSARGWQYFKKLNSTFSAYAKYFSCFASADRRAPLERYGNKTLLHLKPWLVGSRAYFPTGRGCNVPSLSREWGAELTF
jgi:hypothetical protein